MKELKRLTAIVLSLVMVLGAIPNMNLKAHAATPKTFKIMGDGNDALTGEVGANDGVISLPYSSEYTATLFDDNTPKDNNINVPCYPDLKNVEAGVETEVVFGPFTTYPDGYYNSQDEINDHFGMTADPYCTAEEFYINYKPWTDYNNFVYLSENNKYFISLKVKISPSVIIDEDLKNAKVFVDNKEPSAADTVALACIPDPGYVFDSYYVVKDDGTKDYITGNTITVPNPFDKHIVVGAKTSKYEIKFDAHMERRIERVAEVLYFSPSETEDFKKFIGSLSNYDNYLNSTKFILDLIRPIYLELYKYDYENNISGLNSLEKYAKDLSNQAGSLTLAMSQADTAKYDMKIMGLLMLSYIEYLDNVDNSTISGLGDEDFFDLFGDFISTCSYQNDGPIISKFNELIKTVINNMESYSGFTGAIATYGEPKSTPLKELILKLDDDNFWINVGEPFILDDYERYSLNIRELIENLRNKNMLDSDEESILKYGELQDIAENEVKEWALEGTSYSDTLEKLDGIFDYEEEAFTEINQMISDFDSVKDGLSDDDKSEAKFEITKKIIKVLVRTFLDTQALVESDLQEMGVGQFAGVLKQSSGFEYIKHIGEIFVIVNDVATESSFHKPYDSIYDKNLLAVLNTSNKSVKGMLAYYIDSNYDNTDIEAYYNDLRTRIKIGATPVLTSGSKKYKTTNTNNNAEKISGTAKKGSTRTITPIEGKKVGKVIVTDKDGNKVEVTPNADGTYSFIQPASNVTVEVTYVNREITLTIGSTEADVDGERSNLDVCPVIRNDRTMLPIRFIAENLGAKVEWSEKNPDYVLITRGDIKIEITLGSDTMKVNGKEVKLDSVAFAENDRTYLPVRAISENLNAVVEWNEERPMEVKIYER